MGATGYLRQSSLKADDYIMLITYLPVLTVISGKMDEVWCVGAINFHAT